MDWHLKTTEKELLNAFTSFLSQKYHLFSQKQLYIWGASVRGTLLGMLMEDRGWKDFSYLDNDKRKCGEHIHGHLILSPDYLKNHTGIYVLVPIEYGESLREQLENMGLQENKSFSILQSGINETFAEEFYRVYDNKYLILGETF